MSESDKPPFIDRMVNWLSPRAGAERAYYRAAQRIIPKAIPDERPYPRDYRRERDTEAEAVYGAGTQTRLDTSWPISRSLKGVNSPLNRWRLTRLRDRSRELDRNNAVVTGMLDRASENVIGHGMRARPTTDDNNFNDQVEELWTPWLETADITGEHGAAEYQRLLHRCKNRDGDIGVNLVSRGSDAFLQAIEGDLIDTMNGGYDLAERIVNGIQFNEDNKPTAYYTLQFGVSGVQLESTGIPARNFIFYARRKGFTETRGEPCFAQTDRMFDQIDGYVEASVVAARVAACQALIIKKKDGGKIIGNLSNQPNAKNLPQKIQSMEPGMVRYLDIDEDAFQVNPQQPTQMFPDFLATLLRFTGLTLGLPLELVFLDFSRTTYSSARASLLQAYRTFRGEQQIFIDRVMSRIYRWRISKWVKDGTLKPSPKIINNYWRSEWIAPGWAWIDPLKEIQAAIMERDAGFNSDENICLQHGRTSESVLKSRKKTLELADSLNVSISKSNMTRDAIIVPGQPGFKTAPTVNGNPADEEDPENDN